MGNDETDSGRRDACATIDHVCHAKPGIQPFPDRLHVLTMVSNPCRYNKRYELYRAFERHMADSGAVLYTAEVALGGRPFEVTEAGNPRHLQLRTESEIWHKENALNLLHQRVPDAVKYVGWIDADVVFQRPHWAQETLQALQHYDVVQPFSQCMDLGPDGECVSRPMPSMLYQHYHGKGYDAKPDVYYSTDNGHCGYAWAARRSALDALGGLMDFPLLGSADHHMARALLGDVDTSVNGGVHPAFKEELQIWQDRAETHIRGNVGYVPGLITHAWHGPKKNRRYGDRWSILVKHQYNPRTDIKRDWQGLYQLSGNKPRLRDDVRKYFRQRNEDSIDVNPAIDADVVARIVAAELGARK